MQPNALYYGDNLDIMRGFPSESVDLIYLDPPFNSNRNYNLIFREVSGDASNAQIAAFEDTWRWGPEARDALEELTHSERHQGRVPERVSNMIAALVRGLGHNDMTAYLVMMAIRLVEMHRLLKPSGSLYLHADPTASHYLKAVLDAVFGPTRFLNEITWKRTHSHGNVGRNFGNVRDVLLVYTKTDRYVWNQQYTAFDPQAIEKAFRYTDPDGRRWQSVTLRNPAPRPNLHFPFTASNGVTYQPHPHGWGVDRARLERYDREGRLHFPSKPGGALRLKMYLDESAGIRLQNLWDDIPPVGALAAERLGYPTQKPLPLLERIIATSSNPGDLVLDPFCGCGTALVAAQKLERRWIGIDVTHLSIAVMRARLKDSFGLEDVPIFGTPVDLEGARVLARESTDGRYQFQYWALSLIDAIPVGGERKKGADRGIDGVITFTEADELKRIVVSVKSGHVNSSMIRDLKGVMERDGAPIGLFVTLEPPTREMTLEATKAGTYASELWGGPFDRLQIVTIEQLLEGERPKVPRYLPGYAKAQRVRTPAPDQQQLFGSDG